MIISVKKLSLSPIIYKRFLRVIVIILILLTANNKGKAQFSIIGGINNCHIRNNNLIQNQKNTFAYHFGLSFRISPFKNIPKLSFQNELLFNRKGYQQHLDKTYIFQFNYLSFQILASYPTFKNLSIQIGFEISQLLYTNIEQGTKTYNNTDNGIILGISCFEKRRISLYSKIIYGLMPMLDYYSFDKLGNFTGEIHDYKNICFSLGLKLNILYAKIH